MSVPDWLEPMAATLTDQRFVDPAWIFERKLDGVRLLAYKDGTTVRLYSRNRLPQSCPPIGAAIEALPVAEAVLDGELTWGHTLGGRPQRTGGAPGVAYHVFDVLWLDGRRVTGLPLDDRRSLLASLPLEPPLYRVDALTDREPWERACREGWEGVIAKRRDAPYEHRRSKHWLKMKCEVTGEFLVGGFTDPQGGRVGLGALLVGCMEGTELVFAGKVGTGFDAALLRDLRAQLDALAVPASPFTRATGLPRLRVHWARPVIRVKVAFIEWTAHGKLRHSRLLQVIGR